ncbi:MAG: alpha/beta hydrolase [Dehalococcoidales bacterium]|nr:MAG: alpha/beta hydrolase [Dehalococcoidales bacterium]
MLLTKFRILSFFLSAVFCTQFLIAQPVHAEGKPEIVKELNFVFCHGMGGNPCTFQNITDRINEILPYFIDRYQEKNPGISVKVNFLDRCYPGHVDINTWANNIADSINERFEGKDNLILVGHSMGGKTALFATAHNVGNITNRVAAVITINSPIKKLDDYYVPGGGPMPDYCRTTLLGSDQGVCDSVAFYDSSADGLKVSREKRWLAFISAEPSPLSPLYNQSGVDIWPRNLDDGVVPLPAQFSEGADVVYYGEAQHSDVGAKDTTSLFLANNIMFYIFGYEMEFSIPARTGIVEHEADWLLGTDRWSDIVGGIVTANGTIIHKNSSFYKWEKWEDIIGQCEPGDERSYSHVHLDSVPILTSIRSASWVNSTNTSDCRLSVSTSAAPFTTVKADWTIFSAGLLPEETPRSFYDIEIIKGTPLASITDVKWWKDDPLNPVIWIRSQAQSPFRWFEARWSTYKKEKRIVNVIDDIPVKVISPEVEP